MPGFFDDPVVAGVVVAGLAVLAILLNVPALRWQGRFNGRAKNRERIDELVDSHYHPDTRKPWNCLYRFEDDLSLPPRSGLSGQRRLLARVALVDGLDPDRRQLGCAAASDWARTVGTLAKKVSLEDKVPLRTFLATYHLMVIRHAALAEPFLLWLQSEREHSRTHTFEQMCWALALRDLAVVYNTVARQQREPVTFLVKKAERQPHVILEAPSSGLLLRTIEGWFVRWYRLWWWRRRLARRHVRRAARALMESPSWGVREALP